MKYSLRWLDGYNLENWDNEFEEGKTDNFSEERAIKNLKDSFPITKLTVAYDGWADCEHAVSFEANNKEEIQKEVERIIDEQGRIIDVWSVIDENENVVLTEEDLEEVE